MLWLNEQKQRNKQRKKDKVAVKLDKCTSAMCTKTVFLEFKSSFNAIYADVGTGGGVPTPPPPKADHPFHPQEIFFESLSTEYANFTPDSVKIMTDPHTPLGKNFAPLEITAAHVNLWEGF